MGHTTRSTMRRLLHILVAAFAVSFVFSAGDAFAASKSKVKKVGIKSMDTVFSDVKSIDQKLLNAKSDSKRSRYQINKALGLKKGTTLSDGLKQLKKKGKGKLKMSVSGGVPKLKASDAVPDNVAAGVDAVNSAASYYVSALKDLASLPSDSQKLVKKAEKFPDKFRSEVGGIKITSLKKSWTQLKQIKTNLEVASGLPKRAKAVLSSLTKNLKTVTKAFGLSWPIK